MPFPPALSAVIGIFLQCVIQDDSKAGHHYVCSQDSSRWDLQIVTWLTKFDSLPEKIRKDLETYDPKLAKHLADYSNLCQYDEDIIYIKQPSLIEEEMAEIFCPEGRYRCNGWKDGKRCTRAQCKQSYPTYAMIIRGVHKLQTGCMEAQKYPEWNAVITLLEQTRPSDKD